VVLAELTVADLPLKSTWSSDGVELNPEPVIVTLVLNGPELTLKEVTDKLLPGAGNPFFEQDEDNRIANEATKSWGITEYFMV
jgi:hypothetical protein